MIRIKTHTPVKLNKSVIRVNSDYVCEIIYSQVQLYSYSNMAQNKIPTTDGVVDLGWQAIYDEAYYNQHLLDNNTHYLVFRKNNYIGFSNYIFVRYKTWSIIFKSTIITNN